MWIKSVFLPFFPTVIHVSNNSNRQSCQVTRIKRKKKKKKKHLYNVILADSIFSVSEIECNFKKLHSRFARHFVSHARIHRPIKVIRVFLMKREQVNSESRLSYVATPLLEHSSFDSRRTVFLNLWFTKFYNAKKILQISTRTCCNS